MGIYDREYYRDKTRGSGWLSGEAPACKILIVINISVFVLQKMFPGTVEELLQANSNLIFHKFQVWRLLTATFLHDTWPLHILMNMLFLWMAGREMESFYGSRDFTALYVASAIVSTLFWAIADTFSNKAGFHNMIGASGAVMAVVVLYTLYYPRREVLFMFIIPIEMWLLMVIYLGYNLIQFLSPQNVDQTAYSAHLGGAAFGYLFKAGDLRLSRLEKMFRRTPRLRIVPAEPRESSPTSRPSMGPSWSPGTAASTRPAPTAVVPEELFDEKLDEILVKIAREGRGSLTEDENRVLEEASRRAQNRRSERI